MPGWRGSMTRRLLCWLPTLALCLVFVSLGLWQKGRGDDKRVFLERFEAALAAEPIALDAALAMSVDLPRPVAGTMTRTWDDWLLLDNARQGERVGLRAHALYRASAPDAAVLVDFGWLPMAPDRRLPTLDAPPPTLSARGLLLPMPGQGIRLGRNPAAQAEAPVLLAYLDREELAQDTGLALHAGLLRLAPDLPVGFARDGIALPNTLSPEKHDGYALQWFGFAAALLTIHLVLDLRKRPT